MTDEEAIAEGGPGKPCTFDPTPRELFDENKRLKAQCSTDHFGEDFGDMKLGPLPPGHYWNVLREGCGPIQVNEQGQCVSACEEKHADPPHPTEERS